MTTGARAYTGNGLSPTVFAFQTGIVDLPVPATVAYASMNLGYSTTLPYTGIYKIKYNANWGGSGKPGQAGVYKLSRIKITINGTPSTLIETGDENVQLYEDHIIEDVFVGQAGQVVAFFFDYYTNWPDALVILGAELNLIQRAA